MIEEEGLKAIHELAKKQGWYDKLAYFLKKKNKVLILGSSGVGKTNLIQSLSTLAPEAIHYSTRTRHSTVSKLSISELPFEFTDTPGQSDHKSLREDAIRESMTSISVIINVVCYGYHEYARGKEQAFDKNNSINPKYLELNRDREIRSLNEWSEILGGNAPYRLITIIAKADLWWNEKDAVYDYYEKGDYYKNLGAASQLNPIAIHHSSVFHKFYGIGSMSGSFDENDRNLARANLLKTLVEVVGKGGINVK